MSLGFNLHHVDMLVVSPPAVTEVDGSLRMPSPKAAVAEIIREIVLIGHGINAAPIKRARELAGKKNGEPHLANIPEGVFFALPDLRGGRAPSLGARIQAFSIHPASLSMLTSEIDRRSLSGKVKSGSIRSVPKDYDGAWVEYRHYHDARGTKRALAEGAQGPVMDHIRANDRLAYIPMRGHVRDGSGKAIRDLNYSLRIDRGPSTKPTSSRDFYFMSYGFSTDRMRAPVPSQLHWSM